ncbi:MAG: bifunctional precorrin-2 dehydrogenase/sirohydrochlorin ferrochelatase [Nitrospirae bacterium]|nr:bifunctional precorrin-2 dehydrogenase/sirohydrochlorin ferrochelatase [Nitrospirota bacterium]
MRYYPVFLNLAGKQCVVIGGGKVAQRKVLSLLKAGASVTVISPALTPKLVGLKSRGSIRHIDRQYEDGDLKGAFLTVSATGAVGLNDKIAGSLNDSGGSLNESGGSIIASNGSLLNAADQPDKCDYIVPSQITCGQLAIAVSTSGISPALSRTIAAELRQMFGGDFSSYLSFLKKFRHKVIASTSRTPDRAALLKMAGSSASVAAVREGRLKELKAELTKRLDELSN